jgi:hypothetical protein
MSKESKLNGTVESRILQGVLVRLGGASCLIAMGAGLLHHLFPINFATINIPIKAKR